MADDTLLPCPFCGASLHRLSDGMVGQPRYSHQATGCPIDGHILGGFAFETRWNARPPEEGR